MSDERDSVDDVEDPGDVRATILKRRELFIAAAVTGLAAASGCDSGSSAAGGDGAGGAQVCLSPAPGQGSAGACLSATLSSGPSGSGGGGQGGQGGGGQGGQGGKGGKGSQGGGGAQVCLSPPPPNEPGKRNGRT